jgi:Dihydroorotate dehydrogenase
MSCRPAPTRSLPRGNRGLLTGRRWPANQIKKGENQRRRSNQTAIPETIWRLNCIFTTFWRRTAEDAIEFLIAGAQAVQVGTANFYAPDTALRVADGIADYCRRKEIHLHQLVGSLKLPQESGG